jgi:uncharacterized protein
MRAIDMHTHIFPPDIIARREQLAAGDKAFGVIYADRRARMADGAALCSYMHDEGVERSVVTCFPFADAGLVRLGNDYVLDIARSDDAVSPFVNIPISGGREAVTEVSRCVEKGARGVGEVAYYEGGFNRSVRRKLGPLARFMEDTRLTLMLHVGEPAGHEYPGKTRDDLGELVHFIQDHPRLRIILAHMGGGLCFYEFMPEIRKSFALVYYDLAAAPFLFSEAIYRFASRFLPDKVCFGSDFPLLRLNRYLQAMSGLEADAKERMLHSNAWRLLGGD